MNSHPQPYYSYKDDELSLKQLIQKLHEYILVIWKNKYLILVGVILFSSIFALRSLRKPVKYITAMTFMVGESDNSNGGVIALPLSDLKLEGIRNHKITEIARSTSIVQKVLLDSINTFGGILIAEYLIDIYNFDAKWSKYDLSKELAMVDSRASSHETRLFFENLHQLLVGNKLQIAARKGLMSISYNDKTEMFSLTIETVNKELSLSLLKVFYSQLSKFYIDNTVGKPTRTYEALKIKEDSLGLLLIRAENALAFASDRSRGVVSSVAKVNQNRLKRNLENISSQYYEIRSNRQKIGYFLQTETPDFQIIDQTFVPVMDKSDTKSSAVLGGFLGGVLFAVFVMLRYLIREALKS